MANGDLYGMQTFDQSLMHLYRAGLIGRTDALAHANEPAEMRFELDRADFEREAQAPPDGAVRQPGEPLRERAPVCSWLTSSVVRGRECEPPGTRE